MNDTATFDAARQARHRETTAVLGMTLFIASGAMLFAALFFAYGFTRARALAWPPLDLPRLPRALPGLASVFIIGASVALASGRKTKAISHVLVAIAGCCGFLALQITMAVALYRAGLRPDGGPYASVFYGLTGFHALHVFVGICGLGALVVCVGEGARRRMRQRLWTLYTHMVTILWLLLYVGVYCL